MTSIGNEEEKVEEKENSKMKYRKEGRLERTNQRK